MPIIEARTIFNTNLTKHEIYQGQSTGKFGLQLSLSEEQAKKLTEDGVVVKSYEGNPLRKFSSRYVIDVFDELGAVKPEDVKELPPTSLVRLEYVTKNHPTAGEVPYAKRLLILELAEEQANESDKEFFEGTPA
jgi:hypothetical protein